MVNDPNPAWRFVWLAPPECKRRLVVEAFFVGDDPMREPVWIWTADMVEATAAKFSTLSLPELLAQVVALLNATRPTSALQHVAALDVTTCNRIIEALSQHGHTDLVAALEVARG